LRCSNQALAGFDFLDRLKDNLEGSCPGVVSCADTLVLAVQHSLRLVRGTIYPGTVVHWTVLYCTARYGIVLNFAVLSITVLYRAVLYSTILLR